MRYLSVCSGIEAASCAWHSLGWEAVAFSEIEPFPCRVLQHRFPDVPNLGDMTKIKGEEYRGAVDLLVGGTPVRISQSPEKELDWMENVADWPETLRDCFERFARAGSSGKTCPDLFLLTPDGTSGHSSGRWINSGMVWRGASLTLNSGESRSDAVESSL